MKINWKKTLLIILMIIIIFIPTFSMAVDLGLGGLDQYGSNSATGTSKLEDISGKILGVLFPIGTVLSVVMLIIIGIKYLLGSVEEKAEYKKTLWPYIVGAFMVFTVTLVPQIIYEFMQNFQ